MFKWIKVKWSNVGSQSGRSTIIVNDDALELIFKFSVDCKVAVDKGVPNDPTSTSRPDTIGSWIYFLNINFIKHNNILNMLNTKA